MMTRTCACDCASALSLNAKIEGNFFEHRAFCNQNEIDQLKRYCVRVTSTIHLMNNKRYYAAGESMSLFMALLRLCDCILFTALLRH